MAAVWAASAGTPAVRAEPTQQDVFRSIQTSVGNQDSVSGKGLAASLAVVGGIVIVAVVATRRGDRRDLARGGWASATSGGSSTGSPPPAGARPSGGPANSPAKLVRELMREAGLTRAQVRQLEALNDRLADDGRAVQNLATLLLCPSLITAARADDTTRLAA